MSIGTEPPGVALDPMVLDALAQALTDSDREALAPATPGSLPRPAMPSPSSMPQPPAVPDLSSETLSISDLGLLLESPARALTGDQASVERLGRGASRRDPIAALDPLPKGRDAVTYSTATVATGREAGIHWPELVAFRLSDEFPGGPFDPVSAAAHAADNGPAAAMFPAAAPDFVPPLRSPQRVQQPVDQRWEESDGAPPWLTDSSSETSLRPNRQSAPSRSTESASGPAHSSLAAADDLPAWLTQPPSREVPHDAGRRPSVPSFEADPSRDVSPPRGDHRESFGGSVLSPVDSDGVTPTQPLPMAVPIAPTASSVQPRGELPTEAPSRLKDPLSTEELPRPGVPSWLDREPDLRTHLASAAPVDVDPASKPRAVASADALPEWLASSTAVSASQPSPIGRDDRAIGPAREQHLGIRGDFPALDQEVHGRRLVWLDSAATTQKPRAVIDAIASFYERDNSNVHRGAHELAARATDAYEAARGKVQRFLGARSAKEVIFVDGATEAINLVAQSWGRRFVRAGDVVLVSHLEHHSNIVPWLQLCEATGAVLRIIPVDDAGNVRLDAYEAMLDRRVKIVALTQVSNAIGTIVPVAPMAAMAHRHGARVLVDGSQAVAHVPVDVQCLGADFYAFSGHKIYGPTGIGVLYGREEVLEEMPPWQGGGSMIEDVTFERVRYAQLPARFEAGTPHLAGAVGLGVALDYVERIGRPNVVAHEQRLLATLLAGLATVPGLTIVGSPAARVGVVSFVLAGHTPLAVGQHLNREGIAVRSGHHCAQPILRRFGHEATVRPSLGIYSDDSDIARLIDALLSLASRGVRRSPQRATPAGELASVPEGQPAPELSSPV